MVDEDWVVVAEVEEVDCEVVRDEVEVLWVVVWVRDVLVCVSLVEEVKVDVVLVTVVVAGGKLTNPSPQKSVANDTAPPAVPGPPIAYMASYDQTGTWKAVTAPEASVV